MPADLVLRSDSGNNPTYGHDKQPEIGKHESKSNNRVICVSLSNDQRQEIHT